MITEENKNLLFRDLSSRFSYGVKVAHTTLPDNMPKVWDVIGLPAVGLVDIIVPGKYRFAAVPIEEIKPYLRPMSSMTEEEEREVGKLGVCYDGAFHNDIYDTGIYMEEAFTAISWLLERHFDINYLIQKGLALEAPEDMYKIN